MARHWPEIVVGRTYRFINDGPYTNLDVVGEVISMKEHGEFKRSYLVTTGKSGGYMWYSRIRAEPMKPYYFDRVEEVTYGETDTQRTGA